MEKITKKELKTILEQHTLWLDSNGKEGKRADLTGADLRCVDLTSANLTRADLTDADLSDANLRCANLSDANLRFVNLRFAILSGANLTGADLSYATLTSADLTSADLTDVYLYWANLTWANLSGADLTDSELEWSDLTNTILDEKEQCRKGITLTEPMTGYKKAYGGKIITLEIPIGSKVFSINNDKRRTNKAKVIDIQGKPELSSYYDTSFKYHVGDEIEISDFNERYNVECGAGIHFFLTREEAKKFKI